MPGPPRVAVVGSINLDLVARCERLPRPGETLTGATFERVPGGKGANQALALARLGAEVRSWRLHLRTSHTFAQLARIINPIVRGWMQYYGAFYRSRAVSAPDTHQRLPGALDPQEV